MSNIKNCPVQILVYAQEQENSFRTGHACLKGEEYGKSLGQFLLAEAIKSEIYYIVEALANSPEDKKEMDAWVESSEEAGKFSVRVTDAVMESIDTQVRKLVGDITTEMLRLYLQSLQRPQN